MLALWTASFSRMAEPTSPATQTDLSWPERGLFSALWTSRAPRWGGTHRTRPPPTFALYLLASTDPPSYPSRAPSPCWSFGPRVSPGSKDNSVAMMATILTEDYRFLHSEQSQVPLELF